MSNAKPVMPCAGASYAPMTGMGSGSGVARLKAMMFPQIDGHASVPSLAITTCADVPDAHTPRPPGSGRKGVPGAGVVSIEHALSGKPAVGQSPAPVVPSGPKESLLAHQLPMAPAGLGSSQPSPLVASGIPVPG